MKQSVHTRINWLHRRQIENLLECHGFACYDSESTDDLREALRECVMDGEIEETELW